jgi:hypothetical protein
MKNKPLTLFFLCEAIDFYSKSGSMMNNLYEVGTMVRHTWCDAERALKEGQRVVVRPANKAEILWAYQRLAEYQEKHARFQNA